MGAMRVAAAALATGLVLLAPGCGSGTAPGSGNLGRDAAALVPPDAIAFVNVDGNLDSEQWQRLDDLTRGLRLRTQVVDRVQKALRTAQLDFDEDVRPAIGDEFDMAVLGSENGEPEAIVFTKPKDESKLRSLVAAYDEHAEGYRVERIGDWSVVADSTAMFQKVREAESGRSLADVQWFHEASDRLTGDALARAYASGAALRSLPAEIGGLVRAAGSPRWVAARLEAEQDAIRLELQAGSLNPAPALYRPTLLRDVPSGAVLAVSFKDLDRPLGRLAADPALRDSLREIERYLGVPLARLAPALRGEGAFYVLPGALLPTFALEVQSPDPQAAAGSLRTLAAQLRAKTGNVLPLRVARYGSRVVLTDAPTTLGTAGGSLVDDQSFKDALAAAGAPDEVTFLAYADVHRLAPILQAVTQLLSRGSASPAGTQDLDRLGTLVSFGARSGSTSRFEARLSFR
jgi:hypothetical protein